LLFQSFLVSLLLLPALATDPDGHAARQLDTNLRIAMDKFVPLRMREIDLAVRNACGEQHQWYDGLVNQ
jgi:hypothetical protein